MPISIYTGPGDPNSSSHVHIANVLTTVPFLALDHVLKIIIDFRHGGPRL